jgi:queuine/archaeosine tRNA-ribosyltransferase
MNYASTIQSMISKTREEISFTERLIQDFKNWKKEADEEGDLEEEYDCHAYLQKYRKQLAKLVSYQKYLKKALAMEHAIARLEGE